MVEVNLDLGQGSSGLILCQGNLRKEWVTVDKCPGLDGEGPDVKFNLHWLPHYNSFSGPAGVMPWDDYGVKKSGVMLPFGNNTFDRVLSEHTLEHIRADRYVDVIIEMWRVSKDGAEWEISMPYATNTLDTANPYHLNKFNERSFEFFYILAGSANEQFVPWLIPQKIKYEHWFPLYQPEEGEDIEELNRDRKEALGTQLNVVQDIRFFLTVCKTQVVPWTEQKEKFVVEY
jgi:hypothetical protein